jgi:hypothetical protein
MFKTELTLRELSTIEMLCGRTLTKLPVGSRTGTFSEGVIGVGQVLIRKIFQQARGQKYFIQPENEPLDSGLN